MAEIKLENIKDLSYGAREAYRTLRTRVTLYDDIKAIAITSSKPKEGKTSVALSLAISMADIDKKVIFIDGDLRKSELKEKYNIDKEIKGFEEYLMGQVPLKEVTYKTNIDNLDMIVSKTPSQRATELLDRDSFKELIPELKEKYDYIIIDTPALGDVIDGAVIARECDGAIMVIEQDTVSRKLARDVMAQIEETGCKILGIIINKAKSIKPFAKKDVYYRNNI